MYQKLDRAAMPAWGYRTTHGTEPTLGSILWRCGTRRGATMPASCSRSTSEAPWGEIWGRYGDYACFVLSIYLGGALGTWRGQTTPHSSQGVRLERGCWRR